MSRPVCVASEYRAAWECPDAAREWRAHGSATIVSACLALALGAIGAMWLTISAAHAASGDSPSDYAGSIPLTTSGNAAHYRIDLPIAVYAGIRHPDLSDMRVVNGAGEFVPYSVIGGREQPQSDPPKFSGSVFAIRGEAG